jgi:hypothetical protein
MQQKIIQVGNKKLWVLDMPCYDPFIVIPDYNDGKPYLFFENNGEYVREKLTEGVKYQITGFKTDLTESQWAEIVTHILGLPERMYMDYNNEAMPG